MEQVRPVLPLRRHPLGHRCHTVLPVPAGQVLQVVVHRVVALDVVGVHVASDILVPAADTLLQGPHGNRIPCLLRQVLIGEAHACSHPILSHTPHHVLPQLVVRIEEDVDLHRQQRLRRDGLCALDALPLHIFPDVALAIGVLKHLLHQFVLVPEVSLHHRLTLGDGHRDARLHAVLRQPRQRGMPPFLPVGDALRIVVGLRQVELKDCLQTAVEIPVRDL